MPNTFSIQKKIEKYQQLKSCLTATSAFSVKLFVVFLLLASTGLQAQNNWTQKADLPGAGRSRACSFTIGNTAYVGTGYNQSLPGNPYLKDFWKYDANSGSWTQIADITVGGCAGNVAFSIAGSGYVITGTFQNQVETAAHLNELWKYDLTTNQWIKKANFPGVRRATAFGFSINSKGYFGTGSSIIYPETFYKDFWEYDAFTDTWKQLPDFPGGERNMANGFSMGGKGYVGMGIGPGGGKDLWEFDPAAPGWRQLADFPGETRIYSTALGIEGKAYIGLGYNHPVYYKDFWGYDLATNTWTRKADFGGDARGNATSFTIRGKGYIATGFTRRTAPSVYLIYYNDLWEYSPDFTIPIPEPGPTIYSGGSDDGFSSSTSTGQSLGASIYLGGSDDGFSSGTATSQVLGASIYSGGDDDGFSSANASSQTLGASIYLGGNDDGFSSATSLSQQLGISIYLGGSDDGFSAAIAQAQPLGTSIYTGGSDDGFSSATATSQLLGNSIYLGGPDDGFASATAINQSLGFNFIESIYGDYASISTIKQPVELSTYKNDDKSGFIWQQVNSNLISLAIFYPKAMQSKLWEIKPYQFLIPE